MVFICVLHIHVQLYKLLQSVFCGLLFHHQPFGNKMMVTVLMATYNGAEFIREQLDSILAQTHSGWELLIRDDQSTDETVAIVEAYAAKDSRIKLLDLPGAHGSSVINFSVLFDYAYAEGAAYLMFTDQDDVWKPNKIGDSLQFMQQKEQVPGAAAPILTYSLLEYVDRNGVVIPQELPMPATLTMRMLLCENHAYGCTMMLNRALIGKVVHIPVSVENHDYWIALVACGLGKSFLNPEKLIQYRQHEKNVSGNVYRNRFSARLFRYVKQVDYLLPVFVKNLNMVQTFYAAYSKSLTAETERLTSGYLHAYQRDTFALFLFMLGNKLRKLGFMQTFAHYFITLRLRKRVILHLSEVND
jgi:rhamnosyltransferase